MGYEIDWRATALLFQTMSPVVAICGSVGTAVFLQDRDRKKRREAELIAQHAAVTAIVGGAAETASRVARRASQATANPNIIRRLTDELAIADRSVAGINLVALSNTELIGQIDRVHRGLASLRRRLGDLNDQLSQPSPADVDFDGPLGQVQDAFKEIKAANDLLVRELGLKSTSQGR